MAKPPIGTSAQDAAPFHERARFGLWIVVAATVVFAVADLLLRRNLIAASYASKAAHLVVTMLAIVALRRNPSRMVGECIVVATLTVVVASSALQGLLAGDDQLTLLLTSAMLLATAVMLPWSVRAQLVLGIVLSTVAVAQWWLLARDGAYAVIGLFVVVAASLVVARDMGRSRRAAARAAALMRWHERALEEFLENAHDLIQWVGVDGRFVYVNRSWRRTLGYSEGEIPALRVGDVFLADSLPVWTEACDRVASGGVPDERIRATLKASDGSQVMVEGHIQRSHEGESVVRAILRDVTERNMAESAKDESQVFLRAVLGAVPSLIMTVSPEGRMLFINRTVAGYTREQATGASIFDFLEPGYHDAVRRSLERAYAMREVVDFEAEGAGANGTTSFYRTRVAPIEYAGEVKALALVSTDATEEREAELRRGREAAVAAALLHIGKVLIAPLGQEELLERLARATTEAFGCETSHTFLRDADGAFRTVAGHGDTPEMWETLRRTRIPELLVEPILRRLAEKGVFQIAADSTPHDPAMAMARRFGITAAVYVPLRRGSQLVGVHTIAFRGRRTPVEPWVEELAREVGDLVSLRLRGASG